MTSVSSLPANSAKLWAAIAPYPATLIAVSKTRSSEEIRAAFECGFRHFGENYLQEALPKMKALSDLPITWHYLGRLQSRKLKKIATWFHFVHSLDDLSHAEKLNHFAREQGKKLPVFIEVNLDQELQKGGVSPAHLETFARALAKYDHLLLPGLMTIPKPASQKATMGKFQQLKALALALRGKTEGGLSMGMSADYPLALAAGSTHIRIGTALFGERSAYRLPG